MIRLRNHDWRDDARAFMRSCQELAINVWMFFEEPLQARDARRLGAALISHTYAASRQLRLSSYDRLFPSQDSLPKGGFGNLIALPLQKEPRQRAAVSSWTTACAPIPISGPSWRHCDGCRCLRWPSTGPRRCNCRFGTSFG